MQEVQKHVRYILYVTLTHLYISTKRREKSGNRGQKKNEKLKISKTAIHRRLLYSSSFSSLKKERRSHQFVEELPPNGPRKASPDSPNMKGAKFIKKKRFRKKKRIILRDLFAESEGKNLNLFFICFLVIGTNTILEHIFL